MSPLSTSAVFVLLSFVAAEPAAEKSVTYVDLQPKTNQKLKDPFHGSSDANDLAELKEGKQTLEGLKFNIGKGLIQLANDNLKDQLPEKVEGIKVDAKFAKLHILQATGHSADDDTVIAKYVLHYADKSVETIEVVYGKDVRDWWYLEGEKETSRAKVVWKGDNEDAKASKCGIRLYMSTWKNPKPDKKVASIDYIGRKADTAAAPFCIAMTMEEE
jgi:hypothetical protein